MHLWSCLDAESRVFEKSTTCGFAYWRFAYFFWTSCDLDLVFTDLCEDCQWGRFLHMSRLPCLSWLLPAVVICWWFALMDRAAKRCFWHFTWQQQSCFAPLQETAHTVSHLKVLARRVFLVPNRQSNAQSEYFAHFARSVQFLHVAFLLAVSVVAAQSVVAPYCSSCFRRLSFVFWRTAGLILTLPWSWHVFPACFLVLGWIVVSKTDRKVVACQPANKSCFSNFFSCLQPLKKEIM